jgi:dethiobiotin synthetase
MNTKAKTVFSPKLVKILMAKGYKIVNIKPNRKFPERTVFYFEETPELLAEIKNYKVNSKIK